MNEKTQEKSLIKINDNKLFHKIKNFLNKLFNKKNEDFCNTDTNKVSMEEEKALFIKSIKNIENDEIKLLKLQKKFRNGEIKEEELSKEQINALCQLYDKQIEELKKSNEIRKQRLLINRENIN